MKTFLLTCSLLLTLSLQAQKEPNCAANANEDDTICYLDRQMFLNALHVNDYYSPLTSTWSIVSVPPAAIGNVSIVTPTNSLTSNVTCSVYPWPTGSYTFQFMVKCTNGFFAVDNVTIVVQPAVTQAEITMLDNSTPPNLITTCKTVDLQATIPGANEDFGTSYTPLDNKLDIDYDELTGILTVTRINVQSSSQGNCQYQVVYSIDNGGCISYDTVSIYFVGPQDPNNDDIIEGHIFGSCPRCGNVLILQGDRPGCGAAGYWSLVDPSQAPYVTFSDVNTVKGDAKATVSQPGTYVFQYCTDGGMYCPPSCDTISCTVLSMDGISLGPDQYYFLCDSVVAPGNYDFTIPYTPNAVITSDNNSTWYTITQPNATTIRVTVNTPVNVHESGNINFIISATMYFIDKDCDGTFDPYTPSSTDPAAVHAEIQKLIDMGICIDSCRDQMLIFIEGSPTITLEADTVNFLCSSGTEFIQLSDYYLTSVGSGDGLHIVEIHVLEQDGTPIGPVLAPNASVLLDGGNGSHYVFEIYSAWVNPLTNDTCSLTDTLYINIFTPAKPTAGSDQFKCFNEATLLNGSDPYGGQVQGTWRQVNCGGSCTVTFSDPHDRNAQVFFTGINWNDLPVDLYFEWSFTATDTNCHFSDTTIIHVDSCLIACDSIGLSVAAKCIGDSIKLVVLDKYGHLIGYPYLVLWNTGQTGNPVTVADPGNVFNYAAQVVLLVNNRKICVDTIFGSIQCDSTPLLCGIRLVESCDRCGNVVVTAVDENGNPVPYWAYHDTFRWVVFGDPTATSGVVHQNVGSITVHPGACYTLLYEHYYYPNNPHIPQVPGTQDSICRIQFPKICVSIECEGPCDTFPIFHIAGCGDDLDLLHNLTFPSGCQSISNGISGTLGVFDENWNPVNPSPYTITWENGSHTTYVNGQITTINTVRIEDPNRCCFWEGGYTPSCMCSCTPHSLQCEQPIVKYCNQDGSVTYIPGPLQITWYGVPGAASYILEVSFANTDECCTNSPVPATQYINVTGTTWVFPSTWGCFTVRVKAVNPNGICKETEWSQPYRYCRGEITCTPVITVCGCCHGERAMEYAGLKAVVVDEEVLATYLQEYPGTSYSNLQDALNAVGEGQLSTQAFKVYPNPANDVLYIQPAQWIKGAYAARIQDLLQREWQKAALTEAAETSLHIGNLPAGIYLVSIQDSNGTLLMTQKVIVARQ